MAETVLKKSSGHDATLNRSCSYELLGEFITPTYLYCTVALATYMPYQDDIAATKLPPVMQKSYLIRLAGSIDSHFF